MDWGSGMASGQGEQHRMEEWYGIGTGRATWNGGVAWSGIGTLHYVLTSVAQ